MKKESLQEKFKLGPPRKSRPLSLVIRSALKLQADRHLHNLKMGEIYKNTETRKFGYVKRSRNKTMIKFHCNVCNQHQPVILEPLRKDELNPKPWGDVVCAECYLVIATYSAENEGVLQYIEDIEP